MYNVAAYVIAAAFGSAKKLCDLMYSRTTTILNLVVLKIPVHIVLKNKKSLG